MSLVRERNYPVNQKTKSVLFEHNIYCEIWVEMDALSSVNPSRMWQKTAPKTQPTQPVLEGVNHLLAFVATFFFKLQPHADSSQIGEWSKQMFSYISQLTRTLSIAHWWCRSQKANWCLTMDARLSSSASMVHRSEWRQGLDKIRE